MRRTRPRVVWLPASTEGSAIVSSATTLIGGEELAITGPAGNFQTDLFPIVVDQPASANTAEQSLSDFEGSAYRLRRIVGKFWAGRQQVAQETNAPQRLIIYAGFIILRVDTNGAALSAATPVNYHPGLLESERDPWIWRRSWLIGNQGLAGGGAAIPSTSGFDGLNCPPRGTWDYGSVSDGPHIDAKTARIVSDEERLFLVVGATALDGQQGETAIYSFLADLRVLASMKQASGNRRNASR